MSDQPVPLRVWARSLIETAVLANERGKWEQFRSALLKMRPTLLTP